MDHWYRPSDREITLHTVLAYFNDDFEGGETAFQEQLEEVVIPKRGRVAIFQHKIRHEGRPVLQGTKYAMRSDVVYETEAVNATGRASVRRVPTGDHDGGPERGTCLRSLASSDVQVVGVAA